MYEAQPIRTRRAVSQNSYRNGKWAKHKPIIRHSADGNKESFMGHAEQVLTLRYSANFAMYGMPVQLLAV
ncbi:hypothetical protein Hypma_001132 [Hypsizygus marmoreus]|uniref:Uncharacterized protein n=1 Tax=Hypsizygus marmoreus TaxID=39966 RepID=A0A369J6Q6_HYPMA|nr:hypothetical protein Hypma_001132 [Hypsizygus marmoreus]